MMEFIIPEMDCGGCVAAITRAVRELDPTARVDADLETKKVSIEAKVAPEQLRDAIELAGFTIAA